MNIYEQLFIFACVVCFVVDLSGFTQTWKSWLSKWLEIPVGTCKPFDCSLCMTWWMGLFYAATAGNFTIGVVGYIAVLSLMASAISEMLQTFKDLACSILRLIENLIEKI